MQPQLQNSNLNIPAPSVSKPPAFGNGAKANSGELRVLSGLSAQMIGVVEAAQPSKAAQPIATPVAQPDVSLSRANGGLNIMSVELSENKEFMILKNEFEKTGGVKQQITDLVTALSFHQQYSSNESPIKDDADLLDAKSVSDIDSMIEHLIKLKETGPILNLDHVKRLQSELDYDTNTIMKDLIASSDQQPKRIRTSIQALEKAIRTCLGKRSRLGTLRRKLSVSIRGGVRSKLRIPTGPSKKRPSGEVEAKALIMEQPQTIDFSKEMLGALDRLFIDFGSSSFKTTVAKANFDELCLNGDVEGALVYIKPEGQVLLKAAIGTQKTTNLAEEISKQVMTKLEGSVITREQTIDIPVISAGVLSSGVGLRKGTAVSVKEGALTLETTRGIKTTAKIGVDGAVSLSFSLAGEQIKSQKFNTGELKTELMDAAKSTIIKLLTRTMGDKIDLSELKAAKSMMSSGTNSARRSLEDMSDDIIGMENGMSNGSLKLIDDDGTSSDVLLMQKEDESDKYSNIFNIIRRMQLNGPRAADAKTTYKTTFDFAVNSFGGNLTGKLTVSKEWNGDRQLSFEGVVASQSLVVRHTKGVGGSTVDIETDLSASRLKSSIEEWAGVEPPQVDDSEEVKDFEGFMTDFAQGAALDETLEDQALGKLEEERDDLEKEVVTKGMEKLGLEPGHTGKTYLKVGRKYVKICTFDLEDEAGTPVTSRASSVLGNLPAVYGDKTNIHKKSNIKYTGKAGLDQAIKTLKYEEENKRKDLFVEAQSLFFDTITKRATSSYAKERARFVEELEGLGLSGKLDELQALASSPALGVPERNNEMARILLDSPVLLESKA